MKRLQNVKIGETFKYGGFDWVKLNDQGFGITVIMKDCVPDKSFDKNSNNWKNSMLRDWLNNAFLSTLINNGAKLEDFFNFKRYLTADDGMTDHESCVDRISLITSEEYRKYRRLIPIFENVWWTLTPFSCKEKYLKRVGVVDTNGALYWGTTCFVFRNVHPLCDLKPKTLVSPIEDKETTETTLTEKIRQWFVDRNLDKADPKAQVLKLMEEVGELAEGLAKNKSEQVKDSIGDTYVVLTGLAMQLGMDIEDCIEFAYNEIKDRKGKTVDGVFVKESDLWKEKENDSV